ncbi:MAG: hypothetical protein Q9213_001778 [Squamulea squamosa]
MNRETGPLVKKVRHRQRLLEDVEAAMTTKIRQKIVSYTRHQSRSYGTEANTNGSSNNTPRMTLGLARQHRNLLTGVLAESRKKRSIEYKAQILSSLDTEIRVLAIATFGTTWFVFRYEVIYITKPQNDTSGKGYPLALNQLFTGVYTMHACVIGLFLLERTPEDHLACLPQALLTLVVATMTVIFQVILTQAFQSLIRSLPLLSQPSEERRGIWKTVWETSRGWVGTRNIARQRGRSTFGEPGIELSATNNSPLWTDLSEHDREVAQDSTHLDNPYTDAIKMTLWLPRDPYGICDSMIAQFHQLHPQINITSEGASITAAGRLRISKAPDNIR